MWNLDHGILESKKEKEMNSLELTKNKHFTLLQPFPKVLAT